MSDRLLNLELVLVSTLTDVELSSEISLGTSAAPLVPSNVPDTARDQVPWPRVASRELGRSRPYAKSIAVIMATTAPTEATRDFVKGLRGVAIERRRIWLVDSLRFLHAPQTVSLSESWGEGSSRCRIQHSFQQRGLEAAFLSAKAGAKKDLGPHWYAGKHGQVAACGMHVPVPVDCGPLPPSEAALPLPWLLLPMLLLNPAISQLPILQRRPRRARLRSSGSSPELRHGLVSSSKGMVQ